MNISRQILSFILPVTVLVVIPLLIEESWILPWDRLTFAGGVITIAGLGVLLLSVRTMIQTGKGTLAPWDPAVHLIVVGLYSHTRNPMITGVLITLLGESMIVHSVRIFIWLLAFFVLNNIYFTLFEEPRLIERFGEDYMEYKKNVPRWIPRFKPWKPTPELRDRGKSAPHIT